MQRSLIDRFLFGTLSWSNPAWKESGKLEPGPNASRRGRTPQVSQYVHQQLQRLGGMPRIKPMVDRFLAHRYTISVTFQLNSLHSVLFPFRLTLCCLYKLNSHSLWHSFPLVLFSSVFKQREKQKQKCRLSCQLTFIQCQQPLSLCCCWDPRNANEITYKYHICVSPAGVSHSRKHAKDTKFWMVYRDAGRWNILLGAFRLWKSLEILVSNNFCSY